MEQVGNWARSWEEGTLETAAEGLWPTEKGTTRFWQQGTSGVAPGLLVVGSGVWHYCVNSLACACWPAE